MSASPRKIAIIGSGPMAIYALKGLISSEVPLALTVFEAEGKAGCGMPYRSGMNADYMLCNAFSKEIPPITKSLVNWLNEQEDDFLGRWDLTRSDIDARDFYPRVMIGEYMTSEFQSLCDLGRTRGHLIIIKEKHTVIDITPRENGVALSVDCAEGTASFLVDDVIIATGHKWSSKPKIGGANLVSPWPYTNITDLEPGRIGVLGSSLSAIDVIVALAQKNGKFEGEGDKTRWFSDVDNNRFSITMVSHRGIMPEPDFFYPFPYEPLVHLHADAVASEIEKGSAGLLERVFDLLIAELREVAPDYLNSLGQDAQTMDTFADAYFSQREQTGGLRALNETLTVAAKSILTKTTQHHRYALLRGHENFEPILAHLNQAERKAFDEKLMPVFGDCYAAIPHVSARRVLALYNAGVLEIIPTGVDASFKNTPQGQVAVETEDGVITFDALIDARGQSAASIVDLPFPSLIAEMSDPDEKLKSPFQLGATVSCSSAIYCLAMPQILHELPFSQGLANCAALGREVSADILSRL